MDLWTFIQIYFVIQAIIGIFAMEYAWSKLERFREIDPIRDQNYPQFRRYDNINWKRWKFYPGAMLLMPTRLILLILDGMLLVFVTTIFTIGHDASKGPMKKGWRKSVINYMYHFVAIVYIFIAGMSSTMTEVKQCDYSYYLGKNYMETRKPIKSTSTIVCNHISWLDVHVLCKHILPAFAPSAEFKGMPILGSLIDFLDSIYIPRGGSEEQLQQALKQIHDRQELIEQTAQYAPFCIFAEGTTTNGTGLIKFKRGAFSSEKTIRPIFLKYKQCDKKNIGTISPAFDIIYFWPLIILQLSWGFLSCNLTILPDIQPNEYLFETHKDKGKERWEIYAWAVRDIIINQGGFEECNLSFKYKKEYEAYMRKYPDADIPQLMQKGLNQSSKEKIFKEEESFSQSDIELQNQQSHVSLDISNSIK